MTNTSLTNSNSASTPPNEEDPDTKNLIKSREFMYRLIIRYLLYTKLCVEPEKVLSIKQIY